MFGPPPAQYVEDLDREVRLTDAQRTQILALLQAQEDRMRRLQDDARRQFIAEQDGLHNRIAAALSPEQAEAFRAWVTRRVGMRR
jgi:hypothetical protein